MFKSRSLVYGSLYLQEIIDQIQDNKSEIWYVSRRARIIRFNIEIINTSIDDYSRNFFLSVVGFDELKSETTVDCVEYAGSFYDGWYKYGHFFSNKNEAVKYMYKRILNRKSLKETVVQADNYVSMHPECLI